MIPIIFNIEIEGVKVELGEEFENSNNNKINLKDIMSGILDKVMNDPNIKSFISKVNSFESLKAYFETADPLTLRLIIAGSVVFGLMIIFLIFPSADSSPPPQQKPAVSEEEEEEKPLRDFTIDQLREFNGTDGKPIYIALRGEVYDVSPAKDMYGPGGGYNIFAGREASRAMAKLSFDEIDLSNPNVNDLNSFERDTLDGWIEKYKYYKGYKIVGKVSSPPTGLEFTREEMKMFNGTGEVPAGRVDAPIYVAIKGLVLDVSYGGKEMYGAGGSYNIYAGIDASRSLAKMSFDPSDLSSHDISDLTEEQLKTLDDWSTRLSKKYPVVGTLVK